ncbi:hypothetical protein niasHT_010596 [Heterodera trifolii]|uniref:Uncharacterized protein n=1 Tax=Heterodera trifolii TaxID=157864 RepID=A0ABD2L342_9BILA
MPLFNFLLSLALCCSAILAVGIPNEGQIVEHDKKLLPKWEQTPSPSAGTDVAQMRRKLKAFSEGIDLRQNSRRNANGKDEQNGQIVPIPDKKKGLLRWQHMSPSASPSVTNMRQMLTAWVDKTNSRRNSRRNASGRDQQSLYGYSDYSDLSANSSPATSDFALTPQHRTPPKRFGKNLLSSIYTRGASSSSYQYSPSPLGRRTPAPFINRHSNTDHDLNARNGVPTGKEIVPANYDYEENGHEYDGNNNNQPNMDREIVEIGYHECAENEDLCHGNAPQLRRSFSDQTGTQTKVHKSRGGLKRVASDFAIQKCGMMPKLGHIASYGDKLIPLKLKLNMQMWKKCVHGSLSGTYSNTAKAFKQLVHHKHNNHSGIDQLSNNASIGHQRSKAKLQISDRPANSDDQSENEAGFATNPFSGRTPSFNFRGKKTLK